MCGVLTLRLPTADLVLVCVGREHKEGVSGLGPKRKERE